MKKEMTIATPSCLSLPPLTIDQVFGRIAEEVEMGTTHQSRGTHVDLPDLCLMGIETYEQLGAQIENIKLKIANAVAGLPKGRGRLLDLESVRVYRHAVSKDCNPFGVPDVGQRIHQVTI